MGLTFNPLVKLGLDQTAPPFTGDVADKGYYVDETALVAAHPTANIGDYAKNGDTDTVWAWNGTAWYDTLTSIISGDMEKSDYDTDGNLIVDKAESVDDGAGNVKTAAEIKTHIDDTSNPHGVTATQTTNTPAGNIAATDVQAAINELDTEKAGLALDNTFTGKNVISTADDDQLTIKNSGDATGARSDSITFEFSDGDGAKIKATRPSIGSASDVILDLFSGGNTTNFALRCKADGDVRVNNNLIVDTGVTISGLNTANGIVQTDGSGVLSTSVALPDGTTATTQSADDSSTKVATTAYVDAAVETKDQFTELSDTPANYTGEAGKYAKVNAGETAIEFATISAVGVSGTKMGSWDSGDTYAAGDLVNYNGVIYKSLSANSNSQPDTNPTDWEIYTKTMVADTITEVTTDNGVQIETITLKDGNLTVPGDLTVSGTTTTIDTTTLLVEDKNIEIGNVDTPTDTTADGGGITLKGTTDKTIIWDDANDNFTSSEHLNIPTGKEFKINNASINTAGTLTNVAYQNQANDFGANTQSIDTISESTADTGVTIDGLKLKDAGIELGSDADGDVYYRSGGALTRLAKGTAEQVLTMNAGATAPEWADASGGLDSAENTDIDTGTETVDTFADTDADACHWHYVVKKGTNLRTGIIMSVWEATGDTVEYNEQTTNDIGDTSDLTFAVDINADQVRLQATTLSDDWSVKVKRIQI